MRKRNQQKQWSPFIHIHCSTIVTHTSAQTISLSHTLHLFNSHLYRHGQTLHICVLFVARHLNTSEEHVIETDRTSNKQSKYMALSLAQWEPIKPKKSKETIKSKWVILQSTEHLRHLSRLLFIIWTPQQTGMKPWKELSATRAVSPYLNSAAYSWWTSATFNLSTTFTFHPVSGSIAKESSFTRKLKYLWKVNAKTFNIFKG